MESKYIVVKGIVQGVGFRPFVYKVALDNNLKGNVHNSQDGVYINIEGKISGCISCLLSRDIIHIIWMRKKYCV